MKRISIALVLLTLTISSNLFSQGRATFEDGRAIKKGFSLLLEIGFPSDTYGFDVDGEGFSEKGKIIGAQIGNRWYFKNEGISAMGFMLNWLDVSWNKKSEDGFDCGTLNFSFLEPGLIYTYALNSDAALDFYYNLQPTIMSTAAVDSDGDGLASAGFGITHALGFALRLKVFNFGLEYGFGKVNGGYVSVGSDIYGADSLGDVDMSAKNLRFLIGFKF